MEAAGIRVGDWTSVEDTRRIQALASRRLVADWPAARIHPGDIDWWAVQAWGRRPTMAERVRLWSTDDGQDVAFGWYWSSVGELDLVVDPAASALARRLVDEAMAWGTDRRDRFPPERAGPLRVWALADSVEADALAELGLGPKPSADHFVQLTGPLGPDAIAPSPELPVGIVIRPFEPADLEGRVACGRAAFEGSTMTLERYRRTALGQMYRPELDVVAVDRHGAVVAFALGWHDVGSGVAELEPVGVHPDHQRRGLGIAVCRATLRAAMDLGAIRVKISAMSSNAAAISLYRRLGLAPSSRVVPFEDAQAVDTEGS